MKVVVDFFLLLSFVLCHSFTTTLSLPHSTFIQTSNRPFPLHHHNDHPTSNHQPRSLLHIHQPPIHHKQQQQKLTHLHLKNPFQKIFEEEGSLGRGITVGKIQIALSTPNRSSSSIIGILKRLSNTYSGMSSSASLSRLVNEVCLALLRKSESWIGGCSASNWFSERDGGKAESQFNSWANREASKFEKEYVPTKTSEEKGGGPTIVVVSLVIEIKGDTTNFDGAGFSYRGTKDVLSSVASDCKVDGGYNLNAAEVFWTPSENDEVLTSRDIVLDFPELIDL